MGVVTIITFLLILLVVAMGLGQFALGFWGWFVLAMVTVMGGGSLIGMLYLIEPERHEQQ